MQQLGFHTQLVNCSDRIRLLVIKISTIVLVMTMTTCPSYPTKWWWLNPVKTLTVHLPGNLWFISVISSVERMMIWLDLLNSVSDTISNMIHMGTICRHVKLNQDLYRLTTGLFIIWVFYSVLWKIGHAIDSGNDLSITIDWSLLWIDRARAKDKRYKEVSVWWKTTN
jgi:hypothetical protein